MSDVVRYVLHAAGVLFLGFLALYGTTNENAAPSFTQTVCVSWLCIAAWPTWKAPRDG